MALVQEGNILAAHFSNMGQQYEAYRYTDPGGKAGITSMHDGISLEKRLSETLYTFLHVATHDSISIECIPFTKRKIHLLRIDCRAARGTPVQAAGDGKVISATLCEPLGSSSSCSSNYSQYLHLSNFAEISSVVLPSSKDK